MNGSEKQVKWAQDIVASEKAIIEAHLWNNRERVALDGEQYPHLRLALKAKEICCEHVLAAMDKMESAKEIIDNRQVRYYLLRKVLPTLSSEEAETIKAWEREALKSGSVGRHNILSLLVG